MKVVITVLVLLTVLVAGAVGFIVLSDPPAPSQTAGLGSAGNAAAVATISNGEEVDIVSHLQPGVRTVVYFWADW